MSFHTFSLRENKSVMCVYCAKVIFMFLSYLYWTFLWKGKGRNKTGRVDIEVVANPSIILGFYERAHTTSAVPWEFCLSTHRACTEEG